MTRTLQVPSSLASHCSSSFCFGSSPPSLLSVAAAAAASESADIASCVKKRRNKHNSSTQRWMIGTDDTIRGRRRRIPSRFRWSFEILHSSSDCGCCCSKIGLDLSTPCRREALCRLFLHILITVLRFFWLGPVVPAVQMEKMDYCMNRVGWFSRTGRKKC